MNVSQLMLELSAFPPKTEVMANLDHPSNDFRLRERECNGKVVLMIEENK